MYVEEKILDFEVANLCDSDKSLQLDTRLTSENKLGSYAVAVLIDAVKLRWTYSELSRTKDDVVNVEELFLNGVYNPDFIEESSDSSDDDTDWDG
uniref:Uncharacterized protein n=1 Tax=Amphimedon queenslandica TaxID=400682 RepID=A0A1X7UC37_AMPQE